MQGLPDWINWENRSPVLAENGLLGTIAMSVLPSVTSQAERFIADEPDWGQPVTAKWIFVTEIFTARDGLEQRSRIRFIPQVQIEYILTGLTNAEYVTRAAQLLLDARAALWVPWWTEENSLAITSPTSNDLEISVPRRPGWFKVGDNVYIDDGTTTEFREITAIIDSTNLTISTGTAFTIGTPCWPCRLCESIQPSTDATRDAVESRELKLVFRTIESVVPFTESATTIPQEGQGS